MNARNFKCFRSKVRTGGARSPKWDVEKAEVAQHVVSHDEFNHRLDEWAVGVYDYICQLSQNPNQAPESLTVPSARESSVKRAA